MFVQLWNSFPEELETTKQEDYIRKCNRRHLHEEGEEWLKLYILQFQKVQEMCTMLQGKVTFLLMAAKEWSDNKTFGLRNVYPKEITSIGQKYFRKTSNCCTK